MRCQRIATIILFETYKRIVHLISPMIRRVHPPSVPVNKDDKIYIHLGCGLINSPGFINVDFFPFSHIHYVSHIEDLSVFSNKYADLIYACHVFEHMSHRSLTKVLKEWYRVLKDGGILRLSVPDFDKIIDIYLTEGKDIQSITGPLMGGQNYFYSYHKSIFNDKYLRQLLLQVGFSYVREWHPKEVEMHSFNDWASRPIYIHGRQYPISLNLEAVR